MRYYAILIIIMTSLNLQAEPQTLVQEIAAQNTKKVETQEAQDETNDTTNKQNNQETLLTAYNFYLALKSQNPDINSLQALGILQKNGYNCVEKDLAAFESYSNSILHTFEKQKQKQAAEIAQQVIKIQETLKEFIEQESLNGTSPDEIHQQLLDQFGQEVISLNEISNIAKQTKTKLSNFIGRHNLPITNIQQLIQRSKYTSKLLQKYSEISQDGDDPLEQYKKLERYEKELNLQQFNITIPSIELSSYIGQMHEELREFLDQYQHPEKYSQELLKNKQGILMLGKPGTGKTYTARYIAKLLNAGFIEFNCSQFLEGIVGESEKKAEQLIEAAETYTELYNRPCVIFLDELDTIGRKRGARGMEHIHTTLNRLLSLIEQKRTQKNIIFLAATNSEKKDLDAALIRSGRFGKHVEFQLPKISERTYYLQELLKRFAPNHNQSEINIQTLANLTDGFSQADLQGIIIEACKKSAFHNKPLTMQFLLKEIDNLHKIKREQRMQQEK